LICKQIAAFQKRGPVIRKILRSRLPERLADRVSPALVELGVGVLSAILLLSLRMALIPLAGDRAPYAFVFLSIVIASVAAGWRSGLVALFLGQTLAWKLVAQGPFQIGEAHDERLGALIIATVSQLIILLVITLYQREVAKGERERERRMELLDHARREIDHRARNNYQTVLSLVQLQAARANDAKVKQALIQVAERITAISIATQHLALRSEDLASVSLRDHLCELCSQLERGLARGEVRVECNIPDVTASADTAVHLAIIVNELVTNALKHAFEEGRGGLVQIQSNMAGTAFELEISDNGGGMGRPSSAAGSGLGQKLVETFARHLDATHEVETSSGGTTHRILVPALT
jgi:two-component sensor histidine kinase